VTGPYHFLEDLSHLSITKMTDAAASRQLRNSESETEDTVRVSSHPATRFTTAAGESSPRPARSGCKRPVKLPSTSSQPQAGKTSTQATDKHIQGTKNSVTSNYKLRSIPKLTFSEDYRAGRHFTICSRTFYRLE